MYQFNKKNLTAGILLTLGAAPSAWAAPTNAAVIHPPIARTAERLQNVPNSITNGSDLIQGDEWTFKGVAGQQINIKLDTRDDFGNHTSGLDPVLVLKDPRGNVIAAEDDNVACSVPQVCGFGCPEISHTLPVSGKYTIVARDYDHATNTGTQCNGGSYHLTVENASGIIPLLLSNAPTVDNGIVDESQSLLINELVSRKGQQ